MIIDRFIKHINEVMGMMGFDMMLLCTLLVLIVSNIFSQETSNKFMRLYNNGIERRQILDLIFNVCFASLLLVVITLVITAFGNNILFSIAYEITFLRMFWKMFKIVFVFKSVVENYLKNNWMSYFK